MCGIAGCISIKRGLPREGLEGVVSRMVETMRHRGPDGAGVWVGASRPVAFGHARLSIIDLSEAGTQPMASSSGRYVITYNGEVYNYRELRKDLESRGATFDGASDTEVILAMFECFGIEDALSRFIGMFAMAVWDHEENEIVLIRDRLGIKPLYYGWTDIGFVFGSELKVFESIEGVSLDVDRIAVAEYARRGFVPAPYSIYRGIRKLLPGHVLTLRADGRESHREYWSVADAISRGVSDRVHDFDAATEELESVLREAVRARLVADVPIGAFLSGGYDSSLVVALMQSLRGEPVNTYSIGFADKRYDESEFASDVASHLGTNHSQLIVSPTDALNVIPELPEIYDEPFADSSQIPTYLVSRLARGEVTVCLSGDGGDELFLGYNRHIFGDRVSSLKDRIPGALLGPASKLLRSLPSGFWDYVVGTKAPFLPRRHRVRFAADKVSKVAKFLEARDSASAYSAITSIWAPSDSLVQFEESPARTFLDSQPYLDHESVAESFAHLDQIEYLPDDILTKVDRASMSVGLEARVPLLDHRAVEFAWRLPKTMKLDSGHAKRAMRRVLYKYVPSSIVDRPKAGFAMPVAEWLRGPLRDWAEALLQPNVLDRTGVFDRDVVQREWAAHLVGKSDNSSRLWTILMFQAWKEHRAGH